MPTKQFDSRMESREFIDALPPCRFVRHRFNALGAVTVEWEPLRLRSTVDGKMHPVTRETEHAYLVRDESGAIMKVNRYTLMCSSKRFELE